MPGKFIPDWLYVERRLRELKVRFTPIQQIVTELEQLRYFEDKPDLGGDEALQGFKIHVGLFSELVENVKAALTSTTPKVRLKNHRASQEGQVNASKREKFWNEYLEWASNPTPYLGEVVDAQTGLTYGIWKIGKTKWDDELKKKKGEGEKDYLERARALKKKWGPPIANITVHPNGFYYEIGVGGRLSECFEETYKPMLDVYNQYGSKYLATSDGKTYNETEDVDGEAVPMLQGIPNETVRPMPDGFDATTTVLITEYWNPYVYQVYINNTMVHQEKDPSVLYILVPGRTSSSKDPSKYSVSIGEILRHNEPVLNRMFTRLAEATDLTVRKRNTIEFDAGYTPPMAQGPNGNMVPKTYQFKADAADALPEGARVVDPFAGVDKVFGALPVLELFMQIMARHSVNPIFKGIPAGASGSGYRDNSLYQMARSQFEYLVISLRYAGRIAVEFMEWLLVNKIKQEIWVGEQCLTPEDIKDWPCTIEFIVDPALPQNDIAEGTYLDRMHSQGHVTRKRVQEQGLGIEQPEEEQYARDLEDLFEMSKPMVWQDVLSFVYGGSQVTNQDGQGLVKSDGQSPLTSQGRGPGGAAQLFSQKGDGAGRGMGRELGGYSTQGRERQQPGSTPAVGLPPA